MNKIGLIALMLYGRLILPAVPASAQKQTTPWPPSFIHSKVATTLGGYHSTTRGTIRLVFAHEGKWLVFRGGPDTYHFSQDGIIWTATEAVQAGRSHLIIGDTIYSRYDVLVEGAPVWKFDHFIARGTILADNIHWEEPVKLGLRLSYYPDLQQDSKGYFTMTGRAPVRDEGGKVKGMELLWSRSVRPGDFTRWEPEVRFVPFLSDMKASEAHENLPLKDGKSYVFGMLSVEGVGKLFGRLFDGQKWAEPVELSSKMSLVRGTDRRMSAVFNPTAEVIHLGYVEGDGTLWYRSCTKSYRAGSWSEPVQLQPFKTFTVVLSLDSSRQPADVYVLFGKTLFEDPTDLRSTYGALYLQRSDGQSWSEPVLLSEPGTEDNWYPNMNADLRHGIGIIYLKGSGRPRQRGKPPLDIMFASTGAPKAIQSR
ncbi:MAG: hypothetical protein ACE5NM_04770 [Sedimentisphaerales bacterium]